MSARLKMVALMVEDMARSLSFYRRLGLEIPDGAKEQVHVEVEIVGGVVLFWDAAFVGVYDPDREEPKGGYRLLSEFFVGSREANDARGCYALCGSPRPERSCDGTPRGTHEGVLRSGDNVVPLGVVPRRWERRNALLLRQLAWLSSGSRPTNVCSIALLTPWP